MIQESRWHYNMLSPNDRQVYDLIVFAARQLKKMLR